MSRDGRVPSLAFPRLNLAFNFHNEWDQDSFWLNIFWSTCPYRPRRIIYNLFWSHRIAITRMQIADRRPAARIYPHWQRPYNRWDKSMCVDWCGESSAEPLSLFSFIQMRRLIPQFPDDKDNSSATPISVFLCSYLLLRFSSRAAQICQQ